MRASIPSQTALVVAMMRALADRGFTRAEGFRDPIAERLLPRPWRIALGWVARWLERMPPPVRAHAIAQFDVVARRTVMIDRAVPSGCSQLVILGAGLDTRAFRMQELAHAAVFEVDHPSTQQVKRAKVATLPLAARALHFVPLDFERDTLAASLDAAGHQREIATTWISEGVVMYLTLAALRAQLRSVHALSAPGSVLIVNYHEPARGRGHGVFARNPMLTRLLGEPQLGLRARSEMVSEVERAGFRMLRDDLVDERARVARLLVATR